MRVLRVFRRFKGSLVETPKSMQCALHRHYILPLLSACWYNFTKCAKTNRVFKGSIQRNWVKRFFIILDMV